MLATLASIIILFPSSRCVNFNTEDFMTKDVQSELRALVPSFFCKVTTVGVPPLYDTDFG